MTSPVTIGPCAMHLGDAEDILPTLHGVQAVITDPPYSSGGMFRGDRTQATSHKYVNTDAVNTCRTEFSGDNRDQRSFLIWSTLWLRQCHNASDPGAVVLVFTDWRQLPTVTDAVQCGGWIWRNLATWWKRGCRMQKGRFSSSAEYLVYGSHGALLEGESSIQNVIDCPPVAGADKEHIAEKPLALIEQLVRVTVPGALVLDPFMGSGTTAAACIRSGRRFIGIEKDPGAFKGACERAERECRQGKMI